MSEHESSSSDEEDLLQFAPAHMKKKMGIPLDLSSRKHDEALTETEQATMALTTQHRSTKKRTGVQKKEAERLQATMDGLNAQKNSKQKSIQVKEEKEVVTKPKKTTAIADAFTQAPEEVKNLFLKGQSFFNEKEWVQASDTWASILELQQTVEKRPWWGDVLGRLGVAYQKQGLQRLAIGSYRAVLDAEENENIRPALVLDVSQQLAQAYRDIGAMDKANAITSTATTKLAALQGISLQDVQEYATLMEDVMDGNFDTLMDILDLADNVPAQTAVAQYVEPFTGVTFLMAAAGQGKEATVHALLKLMETLEVSDRQGQTALAWACKFGQPHIVSLLLHGGAQFGHLTSQELSTWPPASLQALQQHINARKNAAAVAAPFKNVAASQKNVPLLHQGNVSAPPIPYSFVKPLHRGDGDIVQRQQTTTKTKKSSSKKSGRIEGLPEGFTAAPFSDAAKTGALAGRDLQSWGDTQEGTGLEEELLTESDDTEWDQFKVNEQLFGVHSTFDENLYTTRLQPNALTAAQRKEAGKLAKEILSSTSNNTHVQEERGQGTSTDDEEARYGAVLGSGAYATTS